MKSLKNTFCKTLIAVAVFGAVAPQTSQAGGNNHGDHHSGSNNSSKSNNNQSQSQHNNMPKVISARNGNTGISGIGLPQSNKQNHDKNSGNHQSKNDGGFKILTPPNGNTGINGSGLPKSGSMSNRNSPINSQKSNLGQMFNHGKNGNNANKNAPTQADKDAQAAAEKAYVDAQNAASASRGQLGSAQAKYDQAQQKLGTAAYNNSVAPNGTNQKALDQAQAASDSATIKVAQANSSNSIYVNQVNAATAAKATADAKVQTVPMTNNHGNNGSKFPGGGFPGGGFPTNRSPFPSSQAIVNRYPAPQAVLNNSASTPAYIPGNVSMAPAVLNGPQEAVVPTTNVSMPTAAPTVSARADLVLEDVQLSSPATLVAGPAYLVKFRNQGSEPVTNFQVAVLAGIDGQLPSDAPKGMIEVQSLAAGESAEVMLRLPQSALKMNGPDGRPTAFTHVFVAVDLMNTASESDETNNTAVVERAGLEAQVAK